MTFEEWLEKEGPIFAALGVTPIERRQMEAAWNAAVAEKERIAAFGGGLRRGESTDMPLPPPARKEAGG